ncbi:PREDICTED: uncharacterized protein LOC18594037 isoform X1 [Theobroma cacao]|uniref:Uncharacterized protein LOC18594037 isoform X1 n=1 Tax=Theobroma cacao TaxID=3641 RepID=A0AB32WLW1_THECC|nr:PREDICTED: uncharacterized protein LOC18594037 isoform X1 [Theobroma cacao]
MEATFLAKRTLFNIPKFLPQSPPGIQSTRRVTRACLSTAYERAEQRSSRRRRVIRYNRCTKRLHKRRQVRSQTVSTGEGRPPGSKTSFAADSAEDGIKRAVEMAEYVGDTAKKTLDGAWEAAKDTAQGIKERVTENDDDNEEDVAVDEIRKADQIVDTQEYRSVDELRAKTGGYDKAH